MTGTAEVVDGLLVRMVGIIVGVTDGKRDGEGNGVGNIVGEEMLVGEGLTIVAEAEAEKASEFSAATTMKFLLTRLINPVLGSV